MKRTEFLATVFVAGALALGCSGAGPGTGELLGTGGTGTSSQPAAGSGGIQQAAGHPGSGSTSSVGGTSALGGITGQGGTTEAAGSTAGPGGSAAGGATGQSGGATSAGGTTGQAGGTTTVGGTTGPSGSTTTAGGTTGQSGGATTAGGTTGKSGGTTGQSGGTTGQSGGTAGSAGAAGTVNSGGTTSTGGTAGKATTTSSGGTSSSGGVGTTGGSSATGGSGGKGGSSATGGSGGSSSAGGSTGTTAGPVGTISGPLATGVIFMDTDGKAVNAHGGGIIRVGDTFYLHGEYFPPATTTNGDFNGFSMYSSKDLATWKNEGIILPQQPKGTELEPGRKGERPHIIKCPGTGEFVLYAHAAANNYQDDKEVVYATSPTVNGKYSYKGKLLNGSTIAAHSDMGAFADDTVAYVVTESAHVYTLANDCHSWLSDKQYSAINGNSGGSESPAVFKANGTYYWIGSYKTGWRANNNFYSTAPAMSGPWTYQGFVAPVTDPNNNISDQRTWMSQSTWVQPIVGSKGTVFMYWGDHWSGNQDTTAPGDHNDQAGYVFQPIIFSTSTKTLLPTYLTTWKIDIGAGTWSQ